MSLGCIRTKLLMKTLIILSVSFEMKTAKHSYSKTTFRYQLTNLQTTLVIALVAYLTIIFSASGLDLLSLFLLTQHD